MVAVSRPAMADGEDDELLASLAAQRLRRIKVAVAARRKQVAAAVAAFSSCGQGPQGKKRREAAFSWEDHLARLTEDEFKQRYRLTWPAFRKLMDIIRADLMVTDEKQARVAKCGELIRPEVKLAIALRFFAGGSPLDLKLLYHVSKTYVYQCIWLVVDACNKRLEVVFPIDDVGKLRQLEAEFRAQSRGGIWAGQVACIDGVHFAIRSPSNSDVDNALKYHVARKDEYALLCIAMCDAKRRINFYDISQAPTTHDSLAWECTALGRRVKNGDLPDPFFINGDAAFALSNSMITPSGDAALDDFDFHQSSNRMPIECAFGMLVRRWGVLWRPLCVRFDRCSALIGACIRLHNFCIDHNISDDTEIQQGLGQVQPGRWERAPVFDREGRPVRYLAGRAKQRLRVPADRRSDRTARRRMLADIVDASGPAVQIRKKKRGGRSK